MISAPTIIADDSFQQAWLKVVALLAETKWETRNLVVHIKQPMLLDTAFHDGFSQFVERENANGQKRLLTPRQVAYTIFPHDFCRHRSSADRIFDGYNREGGLYARLQKKKPSWGTYFRRMTHYEGAKGTVNQLANIIQALKRRSSTSKAAFTIVIQKPGGETVKPLGGPCLNYVAVQLEAGAKRTLGLLAVYRNHDFLERAYGNYWGLCNLLCFLANQVGGVPGPLTCVSSRAYVPGRKAALKAFVEGL